MAPDRSSRTADTLRDYLPFLLHEIPPALVGEQALRRMEAIAAHLPPSLAIAVECRLGAGNDQVDMQQCFRRSEGEFRFLPQALQGGTGEPAVERCRRFFSEFADPESRFHRAIDEVFLEFDLPADKPISPLPSVFLSLPTGGNEAREILFDALELLSGEALPDAVRDTVSNVFAACTVDAFVDSAGFMASRPAAGLRLNVKGIETAQLRAFLSACGWQGDIELAVQAFDEAADRYDMVTLALDVGAGIAPHFALECFLAEQPPREIRWKRLLGELDATGRCDAATAAAFIAARHDLYPPQTDMPWPQRLVRQSMQRTPASFTSFARRLYHLKLAYGQDGLREVKAYFGAGHLWKFASGEGAEKPTTAIASRRRPSVPAPAIRAQDPASAIDAGICALLRRQLQSGLWSDFLTVGSADEWVSGFIAAQIMPFADRFARERLELCLERLLQRQRPTGGWGYSREYSGDADSTAWVMRLLEVARRDCPDARAKGKAFLETHLTATGGVGTFVEINPVARAMGVPEDISFAGWQRDHLSVTAAAARYLGAGARRYLLERQEQGRWTCYWWERPAYASAMAVDALAQDTSPEAVRAIAAARDWAVDCVRGQTDCAAPTAFDLACLLRILAPSTLASHREAARETAAQLMNEQRHDGSWPSGARLRIPPMAAIETGADKEEIYSDIRGSFTTAAAVGALGEWHSLQSERAA